MTFGDLTIKLSALFALLAFVSSLRWARGAPGAERQFRWAYLGMTATLIAASTALFVAILTHDFRFSYVVGYTSRDLPLLYLISAFWAGQQGTYLLWALAGSLVGYLLFRRGSWEPARVMAFYVPTVAFMHALMLDPNGNPFRLVVQVPPDGRGLNPLLQDPWMATHPPMVFLGYVAATVPAVLAAVALVRRRETEWLGPALRWSTLSFLLLGIGIVLGGFWAYKVLGWGGYWGWDPVENASLVPWIAVTALLHGLLVQRATGSLPRTNLALALATYTLVFYATFLTRSGVLADFSVHSFPAGTIYRILLGIQLLILAVSLFLLVRRGMIDAKSVPTTFAWPFVMSAAIVLFVISAGMVLIGTSWPIISSAIGKASAFEPSWYNKVSLPIYVPLLGLLSVAPFLGWAVRPWPVFLRRAIPTAAAGLAGSVAAYALGARGPAMLLLFGFSLAALAANLLRFVEVGRARLLNTGAALAHLGFAMMLVGIVASSAWGTVQKAGLPLGEPIEVAGRTLVFRGHVDGSEPQDRWRVEVIEAEGARTMAEVGMYRTGQGNDDSVMHKPAILRRLAGDFYIAPAGLETTGGEHQEIELLRDGPVRVGGATLTFRRFDTRSHEGGQGMTVLALVDVAVADRTETLALPFTMAGGQASSEPVRPTLEAGISSLQLQRMAVEQGLILVHADVEGAVATTVLTVEASTKPLIGVLWLGTMLLGFGCGIAVARRLVDERMIARAAAEARADVAPPRAARERPARRRAQAAAGRG